MNAPQRSIMPGRSGNHAGERLALGIPLASPLERRRLQCYLALIVVDAAGLMAGYGAAGYLYLGNSGLATGLLFGQLQLPIFLTVALYNGAYSMGSLEKAGFGGIRVLQALVLSAAVLVFLAFYAKSSELVSRVVFTLGVSFAALVIFWLRMQMRGFVTWRCGKHILNQILIDDGGPPVSLIDVRRVEAHSLGLTPALADPAALNRIGLLLQNIDRVIISCPPERRAAWAIILKSANIDGEVIDDVVAELGAQGARVAGGHGWLRVSLGPLGMRARIAKRLFDVVLAASALVVLAPLLLLVAVAIRLEDGGPALFVQRRVGRGNRFFTMVKFRSMAEAHNDADGVVAVARDDDRMTRVGRLIRRTSIDELPQLFNVLMGEMSLVGPRPHALGSQAGDKLYWEVDIRYWQRHALKPGLTGLAQVRGLRGATDEVSDLERRLNADLEYLCGWTLRRDIMILFATLGVLVHERAY